MSCGGPPEQGAVVAPGLLCGPENLSDYIDHGKVGCLNNDSSTDPASVLGGHGVLRSDEDVDEQLLLVIPFKSKVKLYSVNFSSEDASDNASGPLNVKLFKDRPDMDFADAEEEEATAELTLTKADLSGGKATKLKFVKFQNVSSITIFVATNQGGTDVTVLNGLTFMGFPIEGTDVNAIKKSG